MRPVWPDVNEGYCRFDIRIEFEDGEVTVLRRQNLCYISTITVCNSSAWTDAWMTSGMGWP